MYTAYVHYKYILCSAVADVNDLAGPEVMMGRGPPWGAGPYEAGLGPGPDPLMGGGCHPRSKDCPLDSGLPRSLGEGRRSASSWNLMGLLRCPVILGPGAIGSK